MNANAITCREPDTVMGLKRIGATFPSRLSFMPALLRRAAREGWRFEEPVVALDEESVGHILLSVNTGQNVYTLIGYAHRLAPEQRSDRVIATAWDATFTLFDGRPSAEDVARLAANVPKQEAGRCQTSELVLARANKSVRMFEHVAQSLAQGRQPDMAMIRKVGYLMRTTAVYGSGKFGVADRAKIAARPEFAASFHVEMLAVYLIREFSFLVAEHAAKQLGAERAVGLSSDSKRALGIGNATGLGMAPFLINHPGLLHAWFNSKEQALTRVCAQAETSREAWQSFCGLLDQVRCHVAQWRVGDQAYQQRIATLEQELGALQSWCDRGQPKAWRTVLDWSVDKSLDCQELVVSLLIDGHGDLVDELVDQQRAPSESCLLDAAMPLATLVDWLDEYYTWALAYDFDLPENQARFWYTSEEKLEPRYGFRWEEEGSEWEMPLAVARDVAALYDAIPQDVKDLSCGEFLADKPALRAAAIRVQQNVLRPFAEIRGNVIADDCLPIDLLRAKLAFFGAAKFDPKSDLWTRINMYQGAPLPGELAADAGKPWYFCVLPQLEDAA